MNADPVQPSAAAAPPAQPPQPVAGQPAVLATGYRLADSLWAPGGTVFITGTQALVRLMWMQRQADAAAGLATQGFVSGYRGSPLGMVDQALWKAGPRWAEAGLHFQPAINEELAATQVLGTQRVESDPERSTDGVFALWYGKGPGVDRAGDALKHGNAFGSSPHGGVLVVAGDDHGCVSSSMPHQSDHAFMAWGMPVLQPADVGEMLEFGLYGWALSRFSGAWVGLAALSEVVESGCTVDLDPIQQRAAAWADPRAVRQAVGAATGYAAPADGLHYRWPDLPSLRIESRMADKLAAVAAFSRVFSIDRELIACPQARVGIVTCGKAHHDLMEVLRRLAISPAMLAAAGVRLLKLGLAFPVESTRMQAFAHGLHELLVVEEKGAVVETQLRALFYNAPADARPAIVGKHDRHGAPLISALGELRPSRLIEIVAAWLQRHGAGTPAFDGIEQHVRDFTPPALLSNAADGVKRTPYFCAGCPHNTSTRVPEGSTARAGIGCHFMANWMERSTAGLIQMGGEGVDWVSQARFTRTPHIFQNLGDGTYYHSGYLAVRQAVAAGANITYKILFNDAVAMTGGQPVDGQISVDAIARQVESEGVKLVVVVSDDIAKYDGQRQHFPAGTQFHDRAELDAVQRRLRELPGVTVLIYEQTCAAEKRRRRKKGELADPPRRLFINEAVCEGCGDCTVQSNCVAVLPHETPLGRKRKIDQSSCNKDYRCADGFCPSFVSVIGGQPRRRAGALGQGAAGGLAALHQRVDRLPQPAPHVWNAPYDLLVTGVGGTGVVTVGAVIAMAAHLQGWRASVLDFMGFAQKGGSVLSFVRLADRPERLNQVRIDTQQADALLACDLVVGASPEALQTVRHGRTRVLANTRPQPVAEALRNPDASLRIDDLLAKLHHVAGREQVETFDAQALAEEFLGDTLTSNILALGYAWQRGLVPVGLAALTRAIELNAVAVPANLAALALGRLAAADPGALQALREADAATPQPSDADATFEQLLQHGINQLTAWQNAAWAQRYAATLQRVAAAERALLPQGGDATLPLARTAARSLARLMSYKDEYEVARLYTDGSLQRRLREQFDGDLRLAFHMAPPLLSRSRSGEPPRKLTLGAWLLPAMRLLAHGRHLRGTALDLFGRTDERRLERALIGQFEARLAELAAGLSVRQQALATQIAAVPLAMRGFGHVKLANVALARAREAELLHRLDPQRHPRPPAAAQAGQIRGIAVTSA
ncbi:indolepyruvate ferredoxin oxidoreductase family protein [Aquabacterium sp. OR-4]|uniref:indolepyruvate ferredoxin oxidoreductase family protein n=1 Tax=Aquabacterium sp. OR-4 TaxID=2978127 RepID=UPI0028C60E98|nr:indolepyruvate ferredoxin oxidoreductase family protein [Aquabacterium sp. OR-4]MDT7839007.1 indolepyruvate ferredoxin oxidoreductase family protein [Aquabacterium sp. OR-4]